MNQKTTKDEGLTPGIFITYESIAALIVALVLITGAVVTVYAITEAFYKARVWVHEHREGFVFAIAIQAIAGLLALKIKPIVKRWKWREDEQFL